MEPITRLNQIMHVLRQQMSEQTNRSECTSKHHSERQTNATHNHHSSKASLKHIQARIRERINQLEPDQRDSDQAVQIFVESILIWEFGEELRQDPRFQDMSAKVQKTMKGDTDTWKRFRSLLRNM